jgi:hypothetical protein
MDGRRLLCFAGLCILSWLGTCIQTLLPKDRYRRTRIAHLVPQARLQDGRLRNWVSILSKGRSFSLLSSVQTGFHTHPHSYTVGTGGCFSGSKTAGM